MKYSRNKSPPPPPLPTDSRSRQCTPQSRLSPLQTMVAQPPPKVPTARSSLLWISGNPAPAQIFTLHIYIQPSTAAFKSWSLKGSRLPPAASAVNWAEGEGDAGSTARVRECRAGPEVASSYSYFSSYSFSSSSSYSSYSYSYFSSSSSSSASLSASLLLLLFRLYYPPSLLSLPSLPASHILSPPQRHIFLLSSNPLSYPIFLSLYISIT